MTENYGSSRLSVLVSLSEDTDAETVQLFNQMSHTEIRSFDVRNSEVVLDETMERTSEQAIDNCDVVIGVFEDGLAEKSWRPHFDSALALAKGKQVGQLVVSRNPEDKLDELRMTDRGIAQQLHERFARSGYVFRIFDGDLRKQGTLLSEFVTQLAKYISNPIHAGPLALRKNAYISLFENFPVDKIRLSSSIHEERFTTERERQSFPYRGFHNYQERHAAVFFGRDREIGSFSRELKSKRAELRAIFVHGESGAGKSSFLNAGIIPYLKRRPDEFVVLQSIDCESATMQNGSKLGALIDAVGSVAGERLEFSDPKTSAKTAQEFLVAVSKLVDSHLLSRGTIASGESVNWLRGGNANRQAPTVIFPVDQAEILALVQSEEYPHAPLLISVLRTIFSEQTKLIPIFSIRTASIENVMSQLGILTTDSLIFKLEPIRSEDSILSIIQNPALFLEAPLEIKQDAAVKILADFRAVDVSSNALAFLSYSMQEICLDNRNGGVFDGDKYDANPDYKLNRVVKTIIQRIVTEVAKDNLYSDIPDAVDRSSFIELDLIKFLLENFVEYSAASGSFAPKSFFSDSVLRPAGTTPREKTLARQSQVFLDRLDQRRLVIEFSADGAKAYRISHMAFIDGIAQYSDYFKSGLDALRIIATVNERGDRYKEGGREKSLLFGFDVPNDKIEELSTSSDFSHLFSDSGREYFAEYSTQQEEARRQNKIVAQQRDKLKKDLLDVNAKLVRALKSKGLLRVISVVSASALAFIILAVPLLYVGVLRPVDEERGKENAFRLYSQEMLSTKIRPASTVDEWTDLLFFAGLAPEELNNQAADFGLLPLSQVSFFVKDPEIEPALTKDTTSPMVNWCRTKNHIFFIGTDGEIFQLGRNGDSSRIGQATTSTARVPAKLDQIACNEEMIVYRDSYRDLVVLDTSSKKRIAILSVPLSAPNTFAISKTGLIAAGGLQGTIYFWNLDKSLGLTDGNPAINSQKKIQHHRASEELGSEITALHFSENSPQILLAGTLVGTVHEFRNLNEQVQVPLAGFSDSQSIEAAVVSGSLLSAFGGVSKIISIGTVVVDEEVENLVVEYGEGVVKSAASIYGDPQTDRCYSPKLVRSEAFGNTVRCQGGDSFRINRARFDISSLTKSQHAELLETSVPLLEVEGLVLLEDSNKHIFTYNSLLDSVAIFLNDRDSLEMSLDIAWRADKLEATYLSESGSLMKASFRDATKISYEEFRTILKTCEPKPYLDWLKKNSDQRDFGGELLSHC